MTTVAIIKPDLRDAINRLLESGSYAIIRNRNVHVELIDGTTSEEGGSAVLLEYENGDVKGSAGFTVNKVITGIEGIKSKFALMFSIQGQYWIVTTDKAEPSKHSAYAITRYAGLFTTTKFNRDVIDIIEEPVRLKIDGPVTVTAPTTP